MPRSRVIFLAIVLLAPLLAVWLRFFQLQVLLGAQYREEAETRVTAIEVIPTARGRILDRNGIVLAQDDRSWQIDMVLNQVRLPRMTPTELRGLVRISSDELNRNPALAQTPCSMSRLARMFGVKRDLLDTAVEFALVRRCTTELARLTGLDSAALYAKVDVAYRRVARAVEGKSSRDARRIADAQRELPVRLINEVDYRVASEIRIHPERYPGLVVTERLRRLYPQAPAGAHAIGYVGKISEEQYRRMEEEGYFSRDLLPLIGEEEYRRKERHGFFMADMIGRSGIEAFYNDALKGERGAMISERDLFHRNRKVLRHVPPKRGQDVRLTLDIELQRRAEKILGDRRASAVVCDVATGEIVVLASAPGFDPNELISPVSAEAYESIFKSPARPLLNRAILGEYPLGSVFKVVTSAAALRSGAIRANTTIECTGKFRPDLEHFNCWIWNKFHGTHGPLVVSEGLQHSCNVFFYHAATLAGASAMIETARDFGFGSPTHLDLSAEQSGNLPGLPGLLAGNPTGITPNELLNMSIGQGRLLVTPVQVARVMLALANGGTLVDFRLSRDQRQPTRSLSIPDSSLAEIRRGLYLVVNDKRGTAYKSKLWEYAAAGKTSTADIASRAAAAGNPALKPTCWFAGYAPHDHPRFAFVVVVERGDSGSSTAAPLARELLEALNIPRNARGGANVAGESDSGD